MGHKERRGPVKEKEKHSSRGTKFEHAFIEATARVATVVCIRGGSDNPRDESAATLSSRSNEDILNETHV